MSKSQCWKKSEWNRFDNRWELGYAHAKEYFDREGELNVNSSYIASDGFRLGSWLNNQREKYKSGKLTEKQIARLNDLHITWSRLDALWEETFRVAKAYAEQHGTLKLPNSFITEDGVRLGQWLCNQKKKYASGKLDSEKADRLKDLGVQFE